MKTMYLELVIRDENAEPVLRQAVRVFYKTPEERNRFVAEAMKALSAWTERRVSQLDDGWSEYRKFAEKQFAGDQHAR